MADQPKQTVGKSGRTRSTARLAAVQALYQADMTGIGARLVALEFIKHRFHEQLDDQPLIAADEVLFTELVEGTLAQREELDRLASTALTQEWAIERLEVIIRAILRLAIFELSVRIEVPARVVIAEYVDIAHAFFSGKEPGLINGVLDRLGRELRPTEW